MKKIIISLFLCSMAMGMLQAQNETMYVMKSGVVVGQYAVGDVDSVVFYNPVLTAPILTMDAMTASVNDSLFAFRYIKVKNHIVNHSATATNFTWEVVSNNTTGNLKLLTCDPYTCMPPNTLKSTFTLAKDATGIFEIGFMHNSTSLTKETRWIETITLKVLIYPTGEKEKAITYTAIVNCI